MSRSALVTTAGRRRSRRCRRRRRGARPGATPSDQVSNIAPRGPAAAPPPGPRARARRSGSRGCRSHASRLAAPADRRRRRSRGARPSGLPSAGRGDVPRQHDRQVRLGHRHRAAGLTEDDRDRRAPGALARDREVVGAVALRLAGARHRLGGRRLPVLRPPLLRSSTRSMRAGESRSDSSTTGMPKAAVGP